MRHLLLARPARIGPASLLTVLVLFAGSARAQAPATPPADEAEEVSPETRERIKKEVREELRQEMQRSMDEMRASIRAEVAAAQSAADAWEPEQWEAEEVRQTFFDLDGYFRVRMDAFVNFDLNAGVDVDGRPLFPRPGWDTSGSDTLAGANQRLRLQPTLNVSEDIRIHGMVDVLDNLVWGQTPAPGSLGFFTETAVEPVGGVNALFDSVAFKRVWADVRIPFGDLSFGRMGSHWGLGLVENDGNCMDCDYGDTVDRVMFVTNPIYDHYVVLALDTPATGPVGRNTPFRGQAFDLEQRDDISRYVLAFHRYDSDDDVEKMLLEGETVFNYGLYNILRTQSIEPVGTEPDGELSREDFVYRDAITFLPDLWLRLNVGRFRVEAEAALVVGRVGYAGPAADAVEEGQVNILQFGGALQTEYRAAADRLRLGLELGVASGDDAPGMGIRPGLTPGGERSIDGSQFNVDPAAGPLDTDLNNFAFDPDYHVDLILWREILGRVTDAAYVKPTLSYDFTPGFGFDLSAIYSHALYSASTPGPASGLGLEIDGGLRFVTSDGFHMGLQYGIFFPFDGLELATDVNPEIAQTIQGLLGVSF